MLNFLLFLVNSRSFHGNTFSEKCGFTVIYCKTIAPRFFKLNGWSLCGTLYATPLSPNFNVIKFPCHE